MKPLHDDPAEHGHETVLVVDFGSQLTQLLARRLREEQVYCEVTTPAKAIEEARRTQAKALILSGGPASVYDADAPKASRELVALGIPILGAQAGAG